MAGWKRSGRRSTVNTRSTCGLATRAARHRAVRGRLLNLGNATRHPSFVMSNSFANQTIAQIELWTKNDEYDNKVYRLPKHLDEEGGSDPCREALGGHLTKLTRSRPKCLGVDVEGPYKPDHYILSASHPRADAKSPIS